MFLRALSVDDSDQQYQDQDDEDDVVPVEVHACRPFSLAAKDLQSGFVCLTNGAVAVWRAEVANAHGNFADSVGPTKDRLEQPSLIVLEVAAQCVRAEIGDLDHASQFAVNEQGGLDDAVNACPECPSSMEGAHHPSVLSRHSLVVVMDKQPVVALETSGRRPDVLEVLLEARDHLLKRLLVD